MSFNLANTLLGQPSHLAACKREGNHDEAVAFIQEAQALYPKCPKWASLLHSLSQSDDKYVAGGAMKYAKEIHHILGKKVEVRAESKAKLPTADAVEPTVTELATKAAEAYEAPPEEEAPAPKVNEAALADAHAEAMARIEAAEAKPAPKVKAPKMAKARKTK